MSGVAFITGKKYINGEVRNVFYIGSPQDDGYIYFQDETKYRCTKDGEYLQLFYYTKEIWISTENISDIAIIDFNPSNIIGSGSSVSPNGGVESAVQWMIEKANSGNVTYSQRYRNLKNVDGSSYDCSSFVITGFYYGGFDANCSTTFNMVPAFQALGFTWIEGSTFTSDQLIRGDILVCISRNGGHTQVYIGNNQDVNCGSTPARVQYHDVNNYGTLWDGILRYTG